MTAALISTAIALIVGLAFGVALVSLYDDLSTIIAIVADHWAAK